MRQSEGKKRGKDRKWGGRRDAGLGAAGLSQPSSENRRSAKNGGGSFTTPKDSKKNDEEKLQSRHKREAGKSY